MAWVQVSEVWFHLVNGLKNCCVRCFKYVGNIGHQMCFNQLVSLSILFFYASFLESDRAQVLQGKGVPNWLARLVLIWTRFGQTLDLNYFGMVYRRRTGQTWSKPVGSDNICKGPHMNAKWTQMSSLWQTRDLIYQFMCFFICPISYIWTTLNLFDASNSTQWAEFASCFHITYYSYIELDSSYILVLNTIYNMLLEVGFL